MKYVLFTYLWTPVGEHLFTIIRLNLSRIICHQSKLNIWISPCFCSSGVSFSCLQYIRHWTSFLYRNVTPVDFPAMKVLVSGGALNQRKTKTFPRVIEPDGGAREAYWSTVSHMGTVPDVKGKRKGRTRQRDEENKGEKRADKQNSILCSSSSSYSHLFHFLPPVYIFPILCLL